MQPKTHFVVWRRRSLIISSALLICAAVVTSVAGATATQLLPNGDMEQVHGWWSMHDGEGSIPIVNEQSFDHPHAGKACRHIVITRQSMRDWPSVCSPAFVTETGKTYEVRFWYKAHKGGVSLVVRNGADNDNLNLVPHRLLVPQYDMMNKYPIWAEYVGRYTEQNGGPQAYLRFVIGSAGEVEFDLDDVSVREVNDSPDSIRRQWGALFPGRRYVCWEKSPWDHLAALQSPSAAVNACTEISVAMGQNEYESRSFAVTNLSAEPLNVAVSVKDSAIPIVLREAMWVTDVDGATTNDALPLLEAPLAIPSGESREVWLTLQTRGQQPGDYLSTIEVQTSDAPSQIIALRVKVYPVSLPDDKPLYAYYWDYLVPEWITPERAQALIADMKSHYVNVPMIHPWPGRLELDDAGYIKQDYAELDRLLGYYRQLNPKMVIFTWNPDAYLAKIGAFEIFSEGWNALFKTYLTGLVDHLKETGWDYDTFAINPYDERIDKPFFDMAKLIKEIDPNIQIYANHTGHTQDDVTNIAPYVDIWCPYLYDYLNQPPYDRDIEVKTLSDSLLRNESTLFWTYANAPGSRPRSAPVYQDYRLPLWQTWDLGMSGYGFWVYSYKTHWHSNQYADGPNWAVVYFADSDDAPAGISKEELIVPSKRWEATREGVEDYTYLYMLRDAVSAAQTRGVTDTTTLEHAADVLRDSPANVLGDRANASLADLAKERIIQAIVSLGDEQTLE